ncbi:MAG: topoisomerase C-terminal repeat-containing protein [Planctomycetaceae bacterium]
MLNGPFGPYLQLGEQGEDGSKPKRVSIPKNYDPTQIDLDLALKLMELPRTVGAHPEDGKVVKAGIGRFGPYVQHDGKYKSLGKEHDVRRSAWRKLSNCSSRRVPRKRPNPCGKSASIPKSTQ